MTPNKNKIKGTAWERDFVKLLEENLDGSFKRIASSGSIGTILGEPLLKGDVVLSFPGYPRKFRAELKTGYGGSKQLTVKKEWFDKIREDALESYSLPMLAFKFQGARRSSGIQYFVAFDFDSFVKLIDHMNQLKKELDLVYEKLEKKNG